MDGQKIAGPNMHNVMNAHAGHMNGHQNQGGADSRAALHIALRLLTRTWLQRIAAHGILVVVSIMNYQLATNLKMDTGSSNNANGNVGGNVGGQVQDEMRLVVWCLLLVLFGLMTLAGVLISKTLRDNLLADTYDDFAVPGVSFHNPSKNHAIRGNRFFAVVGPAVLCMTVIIAFLLRNVVPYTALVVPMVFQFIGGLFCASTIRDTEDAHQLERDAGVPQ